MALASSAALVTALERIGARFGLPEATLGLLVALAADSPEVTSALTAYVRGEPSVGAGVVLGSNAFNLAALLGLGASWPPGSPCTAASCSSRASWPSPSPRWPASPSPASPGRWSCLALMLAVLVPYVVLSALSPNGVRTSPFPRPGDGG